MKKAEKTQTLGQLLAENEELRQRLAAYEEASSSAEARPVKSTAPSPGDSARPLETPVRVEKMKEKRARKPLKNGRRQNRVSDKYFRNIFNSVYAGISVTTDTTCQVILHNQVAAEFFRVKPWDNVSHSSSVVPTFKMLYQGKEMIPAEMPIQKAAWKGETVKNQEIEFVWEDGVRKFGVFNSNPLYNDAGEIIGAIATSEDVTERKQAEQVLRQSAEWFNKAFHTNPNPMSISNLGDGVLIDMNESFIQATGYSREELTGMSSLELGLWDDQADRAELIKRVKTGERVRNNKLKIRTKQGQQKIGLMSLEPIAVNGEKCVFMVCTDITDLERAEVALRQSEERFFKAFHSSPVMMSIALIENNVFLDVNEIWAQTMGVTREEARGRTARELGLTSPPYESPDYITVLHREENSRGKEMWFRTANGEDRIGFFSKENIEMNGVPCRLVTIQDITEIRRIEKEMSRLDKLNLVGEMAASIGHEIRNPMTTIRGFLQMVKERDDVEKYQEYYDLMIEELDRTNSIITEYLSMAKDKKVNLKPGYLNSIIKVIYPMVQADARYADKEILLDLDFPPRLLLDEKEIRQLIMNLARNGLEAMESRGVLTIRTRVDDGEAVLEVEDQGDGIPPGILEKIGTPFQTTKENGTGLGLAVCYSIAQRHNAKIEVDTGPGGTTFRVRFKASQ